MNTARLILAIGSLWAFRLSLVFPWIVEDTENTTASLETFLRFMQQVAKKLEIKGQKILSFIWSLQWNNPHTKLSKQICNSESILVNNCNLQYYCENVASNLTVMETHG